jgi:Mg-chelatase subunit ChlD
VQVVQGVEATLSQVEGADAVYAHIQQTTRLQQKEVDFLLLIDISGSMTAA